MFLIVVSLPFRTSCVFINLTKYTFCIVGVVILIDLFLYVNTIYIYVINSFLVFEKHGYTSRITAAYLSNNKRII